MPRTIIIDTNFLLLPFKPGLDIFSEFSRICHFNYRLAIFASTISELDGIIKKASGKDKRAAKFALALINLKDIEIIKSEDTDVDCLILEHQEKDFIVATLDINLKKRLRIKGVPVIVLRKKQYLMLEGDL